MAEMQDITADLLCHTGKSGTAGTLWSDRHNDLFSFRQVGSVAKYVEPVSGTNPLDSVADLFRNNPQLEAIPVEENEKVVGVLERRDAVSHTKTSFGRFFAKNCINYIKRCHYIIYAREYIQNIQEKIVEANKETSMYYFPVFENNKRFFGILSVDDLLQRLREITDQDLENAREVQNNLFPSGEDLAVMPFKVSLWNRMANKVGGDFCTVNKISPNNYIIGMFDVCGKNVAAAMLTVSIGSFFSMLKLLFPAKGLTPAKVTSTLDEYLMTLVPSGSFVTAVLCYVDLAKQKIVVHNCGHTALYMSFPSSEKGTIKMVPVYAGFPPLAIDEVSRLMGIADFVEFQSVTIPIEEGLHLNLASDGFSDMLSEDGERFEEIRVQCFFKELYGLHCNEIRSSIENTVGDWIRTTPVQDDITVMDIRFS